MYKVKTDRFEGPFDLLVYLIENARMDIYDIKVGEITEQYIRYLEKMQEMDIEVAGEFIVLAAVLIRLKSRMLLPRYNDQGELVLDEDPRNELAERLSEYIRTKRIAEMFAEREEQFSAVYRKPAEDMSVYLENPIEQLYTNEEQLVKAFLSFLTKKQKIEDVTRRYQRVRRKEETIEARIMYMVNVLDRRLKEGDGEVSFTDLVPNPQDRYDVTVSFMSLLSMIKNQEALAEQEENFGEIRVSRRSDV